MKIRKMIIVMAIILIPQFGAAEFYKYVDKNGKTCFTDNLAEVPKNQRPKVKRYIEADDHLTPEQKAAKRLIKDEADAIEEKKNETAASGDVQYNADELNTERAAQDAEYAGLMNEQKVLVAKSSSLKTPEDTDEHNKIIDALNKRIAEYEVRRKALLEKINAYNASVK